MDKIFVFSGTSEGREISEYLSELRVVHSVYVATEYGETVMTPSEFVHIHTGRLDRDDMEELFSKEKPDIIIDATHPYAVDVTRNLFEVALECPQTKYFRVDRDIIGTTDLEDSMPLFDSTSFSKVVASTEVAIELLNSTSGKILLTTGVKTLSKYVDAGLKERLIARILPSKESLDMAYEAGLSPKQIVAMEGPFGVAINEALIDQYDINVLVTKNSGSRGGFSEKIEACRNKNIMAVVIEPDSVTQIKDTFEKDNITKDTIKMTTEGMKEYLCNRYSKSNIIITGVGAGDEATLTVAALDAIKTADVLIGARRMLDIGKKYNSVAVCIEEYKPDNVVDIIHRSLGKNITVLVSGDSGFYSGATGIYEKLCANGFSVRLLPAVSSISYFSSKIGLPYSEAFITSSHGKELDINKALTHHNRVFSIVSGEKDVLSLIKSISRDCGIYVGYNLGMDDEKITCEKRDVFATKDSLFGDGLYVMMVYIQ